MFVHLRSHSQYSIIDGLMKPSEIVSLAAADGQPAVALTDNARMFGTIDFYESALKKGVKPIVGVDAWVETDVSNPENSTPTRLLLLAQNETGYKRIMELLSRGYMENNISDKARIKQSWLEENCEGIIALSGGLEGEIERALLNDEPSKAVDALDHYRRWFGDRFYLEVQRAGFPGEDKIVQGMVELSAQSRVPLVATHPIQFGSREDFLAHEVKYCVVNGEMVYDLQRPRLFTAEQHFHTEAQMRELFKDLPEAVDNAALVASRCSPQILLGKSFLPHFPTESGKSEDDEFRDNAMAGLEKRLEKIFPDPAERAAKRAPYDERLAMEVETIQKMGFSGYYLIVADFIRWGKDNGVPVGPGRGSGAGSLAAYALGITDLDPLPYDLLFERFLNPERVSMPDFDIDFCEERRDDVIDYVRQRYGEHAVGRIATYGQLKAKAAIKGAGRALGLPYMMADELSKIISVKPGTDVSIDEALEQFPKLAERYEKMPDVRELIDLARSIENAPQSVGMHAGGVLIAPGKMTDFAPLYLADASKGATSQYDKDWVERAGLVKFDFLGLSTLTVLDKAVALINARPDQEGKVFSLDNIPLDDGSVYDLMGKGDTTGVFQFESAGMRELLRRARPDTFEDIIALAALFRPGPLNSGMDREWCDRKHGTKDVSYPHPMLEPVLSPTYGVIIYQEQVMQIAQVMAGYSLGGADLLRRAMGKKDAEKMAKERSKFEAGAQKNGVDPKLASEIFDLMEQFAEYGFNKSHSAAYALVAYHTAWIKKHYPAEFYAANMSINRANNDKLALLVDDAKKHGIKILPPDINEAGTDFVPAGNNAIRFSFSGVKGVGDSAARNIMQTRVREGRYTSLFDFCVKMTGLGVNKTNIEALVKAGAFDSINPNRAQLMEAVPLGIKYASSLAKAKAKASTAAPGAGGPVQGSLLPALSKKKPSKAKAPIVEPEMPIVEPWDDIKRLSEERNCIGFFLSGHPFEAYSKRFNGLAAALPLSKIDDINPGRDSHLVAGVVVAINERTNRNREKQAKVIIDDGRAAREVTFFARTWAQEAKSIKLGQFLAMEARITADDFRGEGINQIIAENVLSMEKLASMLTNKVNIAIKKQDLPKLETVLSRHAAPEGLPVALYMPDGEDRYFRTEPVGRKIANTPEAMKDLEEVVGQGCVQPGYASKITFDTRRRFNNRSRPR